MTGRVGDWGSSPWADGWRESLAEGGGLAGFRTFHDESPEEPDRDTAFAEITLRDREEIYAKTWAVPSQNGPAFPPRWRAVLVFEPLTCVATHVLPVHGERAWDEPGEALRAAVRALVEIRAAVS